MHTPYSFDGIAAASNNPKVSALASSPKLIVLDETMSALVVSIRMQIINLLKRLSEQYHPSYFPPTMRTLAIHPTRSSCVRCVCSCVLLAGGKPF